jgi:hypothetical protein
MQHQAPTILRSAAEFLDDVVAVHDQHLVRLVGVTSMLSR